MARVSGRRVSLPITKPEEELAVRWVMVISLIAFAITSLAGKAAEGRGSLRSGVSPITLILVALGLGGTVTLLLLALLRY